VAIVTALTPIYARDVAVAGSLACVADGSAGFAVISIDDPASPTIIGTVPTPGSARSVAVSGPYAYVADDSGRLLVRQSSIPGLG